MAVRVSSKHRQYSAECRLKVTREAAEGDRALGQTPQQYQLYPSKISEWQRQWLDKGTSVFRSRQSHQCRHHAAHGEVHQRLMALFRHDGTLTYCAPFVVHNMGVT